MEPKTTKKFLFLQPSRDDRSDALAYMLASFKKPVWVLWRTFEIFGIQIVIRRKL